MIPPNPAFSDAADYCTDDPVLSALLRESSTRPSTKSLHDAMVTALVEAVFPPPPTGG